MDKFLGFLAVAIIMIVTMNAWLGYKLAALEGLVAQSNEGALLSAAAGFVVAVVFVIGVNVYVNRT